MAAVREGLSQLPDLHKSKLDRNLLRDQAAEILREYISNGRIPEGTRLTEREVSQWLGVSRMPAREALMILEAEGLVGMMELGHSCPCRVVSETMSERPSSSLDSC